MHYRRWHRYGDPLFLKGPSRRPGPAAERFWAKADKSGDCWLWTANRLPAGYGLFKPVTGENRLAHRYAFELTHGPIPAGLVIDHLCRALACVRPDHLEAVTQQVNMRRNPDSQFCKNTAKTHCKHGHPFDETNTVWRVRRDGGTSRVCRACGRQAAARYYQKRRDGTIVHV